MRTFSIAFNYIKHHFLRFCLMILTVAIMVSSLLSIAIFNSSQQFSTFLELANNTQDYSFILFDVEPAMVTDEILSERMAGIQNIYGSIKQAQDEFYLANMDDMALNSSEAYILRGEKPKADNEIATDYEMLQLLGADVGDTVKLSVQSKNGTEEREFVVSGMTSNFYQAFKESEPFIPGGTEDVPVIFPRILVGAQESYMSENFVVSIRWNFYYDELDLNLGQQALAVNTFAGYFGRTDGSIRNSDSFTMIVQSVFIVIAMFAGVYISVKILSDSQKKNLNLLQIIGASQKQLFSIFMWQAGFISLFASVISFGLGLVLCKLFNVFQNIQNSMLYFPMPLTLMILISAFSFVVLMIFYVCHFLIIKHNDEKVKSKFIENDKITYSKLWSKTSGKQKISSKLAFSVLNIAFIVIFTFGFVYGDKQAAYFKKDIEEANTLAYDYEIYLGGGSTIYDALDLGTPISVGLTAEQINSYEEKYPVRTLFKAMFLNIEGKIVCPGDKSGPEFLNTLDTLPISSELRKVTEKAGIANSDNLANFGIYGVPYENLIDLCGNNSISQEDYDSGKVAIAYNNGLEVNDEVTLAFVFYPLDTTEANYMTKTPEIKLLDVTITNKSDITSSVYCQHFQGRSVILSDKYLSTLSDRFKYDEIKMENTREISEAEAREFDTDFSEACKKATLYLNNTSMLSVIMKETANQYKAPFLSVSLLYLIITIVFSFISISSELKAKIKSIAILKAVGVSPFQLKKMLAVSSARKCIMGIIGGYVASAAVCLTYILSYTDSDYIKYQPYLDILICPLIVSVIIVIINVIAALFAARWADKTDIYTSITKEIF